MLCTTAVDVAHSISQLEYSEVEYMIYRYCSTPDSSYKRSIETACSLCIPFVLILQCKHEAVNTRKWTEHPRVLTLHAIHNLSGDY